MVMAATNLPAQLTTFLGRELELLEVGKLIDDHRLLTLTGPGGAGKTRLALQAAADRAGSHPDGVWLIELAALIDPQQVIKAASLVVGASEEPDRDLLTVLTERLEAADALLVFDNCEHLINATAELIDHLLRAAPRLQILATSRQALGIPGEWVWPVPTLPVPDPDHLPPTTELTRYEAVELFVERAQAVRPGFALSDDNASAVARICRRLDGLPLAVELAAARVRSLSPQQIVDRLDSALDLLATGARTTLPRQQTLEATLEWSHQLLSPDEQVLYRRLGIFRGGCTLEAAEQVCSQAPLTSAPVLNLLDRLVERSLLGVTPTDPTRYLMLETIRSHAAGRLPKAGEAEEVGAAHGRYFLDFAHRAAEAMRGPAQKDWLDRLEADHANLRLAITFWGNGVEALDMAASLSNFWLSRGYLQEGWGALSELLGSKADIPTSVTARAQLGAGTLIYNLGDLDAADALLRSALVLGSQLGDRRITGEAHSGLGAVAGSLRRWDECEEEMRRAIDDYQALDDAWGKARALMNLGVTASYTGDIARARAVSNEALITFRRLGDNSWAAKAANNLGKIIHEDGDSAAAIPLVKEAVELSRGLGDRLELSIFLSTLGEIQFDQGDLGAAAITFAESLNHAYAAGSDWDCACKLICLAAIAASDGRSARAARLLAAADRIFVAVRIPSPPDFDEMHDMVVAELEAQMGGADLDAELNAGKALTLDQAVGYALADAPSGPDSF
jgi:non-specific serine/threonine protein kinase